MTDKQWDDYLRRTPGTLYGDMRRQWDKNLLKGLSFPISPAPRKPSSSGGSDGLLTAFFDMWFSLGMWILDFIPPLRWLHLAGEFLRHEPTWKVKGVTGLLGAVALGGMAFSRDARAAQESWPWLLGAGAIAGWHALRITGIILSLCAVLVALAIAGAIIAGCGAFTFGFLKAALA